MTQSNDDLFLRAAEDEGGQSVSARGFLAKLGKAIAPSTWMNKTLVQGILGAIRMWFRSGDGTKEKPGILVLGSGGVGKSTLAMLLSREDYNPLYDLPGEYKESLEVELYKLKDDDRVEIIVPPGQHQRRAATWGGLHTALAAGEYRGVILVSAFGHLSFSLSYKDHRLQEPDKESFLERYLLAQQREELDILRQLAPHLIACPGKVWMLSLITKQDLWWPENGKVLRYYFDGQYGSEIQRIHKEKGIKHFRHEIVPTSLVISNYYDGSRELLKPNAAGYDQSIQVHSLRKMFEILESLRKWEGDHA